MFRLLIIVCRVVVSLLVGSEILILCYRMLVLEKNLFVKNNIEYNIEFVVGWKNFDRMNRKIVVLG